MDLKTRIAKWVHNGQVWHARETTATALVIAVPTGGTTTAAWALYNGEADAGKSYVVLAAFGIQHAAAAPLNSFGLVYQVSDLATTTAEPAADLVTLTVVQNMKGNAGTYGGAAVISLALTVQNDRWAPIGQSVNPILASLPGLQIYEDHVPPVVLPPGAIYSLEGVAAAVGVTARLGCVWAEVEASELKEMGL